MEHVYWTLTLMPTEGWIVRRYNRQGRRRGRLIVEYTRLTYNEALQVLDDDSTDAILEALAWR